MATRDREWPAYTQWYCCPVCRRLWTSQGTDVVALDQCHALGPAYPTDGVPAKLCTVCEGERTMPVAEI
ncbi:MAG: hypothetical protein AB1411_15860 [Nitrospirota bacterium]